MRDLVIKIKQNKILVLFLMLLLGILIISLFSYLHTKYNIGIPCLFYVITGKYCPGCGMTRMIVSLFNLEFYQAFRYNMLGFLFMPFILFYIVYSIILWIKGVENKLLKKIPINIWYSVLIITILFGILRNLTCFSFLAPTVV